MLNLESSNKQAISEIKRIDKLLKEKEETRKKSQETSNIVQAIEKPIHLRSSVSIGIMSHYLYGSLLMGFFIFFLIYSFQTTHLCKSHPKIMVPGCYNWLS